jgi:hypothetical protein
MTTMMRMMMRALYFHYHGCRGGIVQCSVEAESTARPGDRQEFHATRTTVKEWKRQQKWCRVDSRFDWCCFPPSPPPPVRMRMPTKPMILMKQVRRWQWQVVTTRKAVVVA